MPTNPTDPFQSAFNRALMVHDKARTVRELRDIVKPHFDRAKALAQTPYEHECVDRYLNSLKEVIAHTPFTPA